MAHACSIQQLLNKKQLRALLIALACVTGTAGCHASNKYEIGISNFQEVIPGVYRGGQPTPEGWAFLKSKGIKTVLKLDFESEGSDAEALKLGMTVVDASGPPSDLGNVLGAPEPERIRLAIHTLQNETLWPIYVHCLHGQDRTGLIVGLFRVLHEHKSKAAAYAEMRRLGFHRSLHGLREVWERFDGTNLPEPRTSK